MIAASPISRWFATKTMLRPSRGGSSAKQFERYSLVQGNVIRLVALDLILWLICARMVNISFTVHILRVHFHDSAADVTGF
jgi:hypothetical protein